jgi:hypothetical protein
MNFAHELKAKVCCILLQSGCVIRNPDDIIQTYSQRIDADFRATEMAYEDFKQNGIDLEASSTIEDGTEGAFDGSFNEPLQIPYIKCTIVSNTGISYPFAARTEGKLDNSLSAIMKLLCSNHDIDESLKELKTRLEDIKKQTQKIERDGPYKAMFERNYELMLDSHLAHESYCYI